MEQERSDGITPGSFSKPAKRMIAVTLSRPAAFLLSGALLLGVAACQQADDPGAAAENSGAATSPDGPDAKPGIFAQHGRLVLPVVPGRPAAVYFTVRNTTGQPTELVGVHVSGAGEAQMHRTQGGTMEAVKTVALAPGATVAFAPGGYHVMAFDLSPDTKPGARAELTLTFAGGDKLSTPLAVEVMGDAGGAMEGMRH